MRFARWVAPVICALTMTSPVRSDVIYVDADASTPGSGNAWCSAFTDLHDALDIAGLGDEVRIAAGTYTPDRGTGDPIAAFEIPNTCDTTTWIFSRSSATPESGGELGGRSPSRTVPNATPARNDSATGVTRR